MDVCGGGLACGRAGLHLKKEKLKNRKIDRSPSLLRRPALTLSPFVPPVFFWFFWVFFWVGWLGGGGGAAPALWSTWDTEGEKGSGRKYRLFGPPSDCATPASLLLIFAIRSSAATRCVLRRSFALSGITATVRAARRPAATPSSGLYGNFDIILARWLSVIPPPHVRWGTLCLVLMLGGC